MLDLIFPPICTLCESVSEQALVCGVCLSDISFLSKRAICKICGAPFGFVSNNPETAEPLRSEADGSHLCKKCIRGVFLFAKARSVAFYDGNLKKALHGFKYEKKLALEKVLCDVLVDKFPQELRVPDTPELVIPVPLYISKLREREYNQSAVLAERIGEYLGVSYDPFLLRKIRETRPQIEIRGEDERRKNVRGAFSVGETSDVDGKSVLVVDDVFTTGSTTDECARVLLNAGAQRVQVLTLMRASMV